MKKITIAILAIAILGLGTVFIFAHKGGMKRGGFGERGFGGSGFARITEKLGLSDEQKTQVKAILEDSKTRLKPLLETLRENHKQIENLGTDGVYNEVQVQQIAGSQAETTKQLIIEKEKTKAQIFALLTPEQRTEAAKMKDRFKDKFKKRFGGTEESGGMED
ncbi:MAG: Spy/CpxP family protein refolding chaperone [Actinomycetota bacterium]